MKKVMFIISFIFAFIMYSHASVCARVSESDVFKVEVGDEVLRVQYVLEKDDENNVKERINFPVTLIGLSESKNSYRWEHTFCFKIGEGEEICEYDLTGADQEKPQYIYSNQTYNFTFFDGDMPYYSDDLVFEYVVFKNKLVCLDCESDNEIVLDDIEFSKEQIDYKYNYEVSVSYVENEGKKYVANYSSGGKVFVKATFVNNSGSNLVIEGAPTYKLVNEVCVGDNNCHQEVIDKVYSSGDTNQENPLSITPYLGNLSYYYHGDNLVYVDKGIPYEFAKYKSTLVCLTNCSSRRVVSEIVLNEDNYYFDYTKPSVDEENTVIDSYVEGDITYAKSSEVKITVSDEQSGINVSSLKYYIITPYYNSCSWGSSKSYSFANGESFTIGEGLTGGYCMYYQASDKNGNTYTSDYYVFYFDNSGPLMNYQNGYDSSKYYNEIVVSPIFSDNYSGVKETYYLWSKEVVGKENYLDIKNNGKVFSGAVDSSELSEDGSYYLYFVSFDKLGNYSFNELGLFNVDTVGLTRDEVIVSSRDFGEGYSNNGKITISIEQIEDGEEFKCAFFDASSVNVSDLTVSCYNNQEFNVPSNLEGEYNLFVYVRDRANNYSLFRVIDDLKIDSKAPEITSSILYDDDKYRIINEITINVNDLSGVNTSSLKYGWFLKNRINVLSSDLNNNFVSGQVINYPSKSYGEYKLYVLAIDNLGNETMKALDKIFKVDTDVIRISLVGEESVTILKGEKYSDLGAKAYKGDVLSGGRVSEVVVEGKVDTNKEGTYYITYTSGEGDLLVSVTRKVIVKSNSIYIISGVSLFALGGLIIVLRLFVKKKENEKVGLCYK